jgi:hypothetical protein
MRILHIALGLHFAVLSCCFIIKYLFLVVSCLALTQDGGYTFFGNVGLSLNYAKLQPDDQILFFIIIVACLPHAGIVEVQKPRNTRNNRSTSAARCWVTHATVEIVTAPRPASLVATQRRGKHISAEVSRHATIAAARDVFCAVGANQQYNRVFCAVGAEAT